MENYEEGNDKGEKKMKGVKTGQSSVRDSKTPSYSFH
jgi:hypothetical protein